MRSADSPETIAKTHSVRAEAVIAQEIDLREYPHQHLAVYTTRGVTAEARVRQLLICADLLRSQGWELVTIVQLRRTSFQAIMRRH